MLLGTMNLLNALKIYGMMILQGKLFYHVSTDEVYGSLGETGYLQKQLLMIQTHHILHLKQVQIILLELMVIHMDCLYVIVQLFK